MAGDCPVVVTPVIARMMCTFLAMDRPFKPEPSSWSITWLRPGWRVGRHFSCSSIKIKLQVSARLRFVFFCVPSNKTLCTHHEENQSVLRAKLQK